MLDKKRLRNYGLWVAVAAFIPMLLEAFGLNVLPENYNQLVKAFLGILVLLGIINNPTTENKGFLDD
ncbi:phage holin [Caminicella sporogenes]|uniref:phage holin n=1 Tax=Caminicella sporogenes TaxID=166485 RepID=UPI00253F6E39|nr:phage holin [Caminicella sporogenes]WIF95003.1 phage holin [Caminicella sporogenes]WIF95108.1 phage holin [Caminicella sporogenes]